MSGLEEAQVLRVPGPACGELRLAKKEEKAQKSISSWKEKSTAVGRTA